MKRSCNHCCCILTMIDPTFTMKNASRVTKKIQNASIFSPRSRAQAFGQFGTGDSRHLMLIVGKCTRRLRLGPAFRCRFDIFPVIVVCTPTESVQIRQIHAPSPSCPIYREACCLGVDIAKAGFNYLEGMSEKTGER